MNLNDVRIVEFAFKTLINGINNEVKNCFDDSKLVFKVNSDLYTFDIFLGSELKEYYYGYDLTYSGVDKKLFANFSNYQLIFKSLVDDTNKLDRFKLSTDVVGIKTVTLNLLKNINLDLIKENYHNHKDVNAVYNLKNLTSGFEADVYLFSDTDSFELVSII
ncbi:hypothetical protein VYP57_00170 [Streptococcus agalactiae]|uniref:hypothetical protein n=1 Tax=Streptococcus agalactiae TaxID=1311 RepID=UPI003DA156F3